MECLKGILLCPWLAQQRLLRRCWKNLVILIQSLSSNAASNYFCSSFFCCRWKDIQATFPYNFSCQLFFFYGKFFVKRSRFGVCVFCHCYFCLFVFLLHWRAKSHLYKIFLLSWCLFSSSSCLGKATMFFPYSWICFLKLVYLETNSEIFLLWFWNPVLTPSRARVSMQSESLSFFLDNCRTNRNKQTQPTKHLTKETSHWNHINLQCRTWATPQRRKFANPSLSYLCLSEPYFSKSYTPLTCFLIWVKLKKLNWSSLELNKWIQRQYIVEWNSF